MNTCTMFANYSTTLSRYLAAAEAEGTATTTSAASANNTNTTHLADLTTLSTADHTELAAGDRAGTAPSSSSSSAKVDRLFDTLDKYEVNFSRHLKILLDALNYLAATETVVFLSLCARLSMAGEGGSGESQSR
jgi:gamma-tubulin complex component 2